ncbi:MAG: tRNA 2-thiouridine(34) synthase MnmA [Firmicutes bacterium]|jgi:tRNA-specific 2-thiouridylase|nr:tRNA 2-thiouridine(34) synthase MnmA [Bacillota bacterium]
MGVFSPNSAAGYEGSGRRVIVAISGGVDSSVAAMILKSKGFHVTGVILKIWEGFSSRDAESVADFLDIPYHIIDVTDYFRNEIVNYFIDEYTNGRTPNPCVKCNSDIKFRYLLDIKRELKADYIATGHYARTSFDSVRDRFLLKKALDDTKDQSYVLHRLTQHTLSFSLFPLGDLSKNQVRRAASEANIPVADKSESQEICFLSGSSYRDFLRTRNNSMIRPGPILDTEGNIIGEHCGLPFYTIGQRKGLDLRGPEKLYVVKIDVVNNSIIVGEKKDLLSGTLKARGINWIAYRTPPPEIRLGIKIRYNAKEVPGLLIRKNQDMVDVLFDEPQRAVTPGQFVVFYEGDVVVGGGTIV